MKDKILNILVIRLSALGDVAMTIPAIYSVALSYPAHHFYVLTTEFCSQLFVDRPINIKMVTVANPSLWAIRRQLRGIHIDKVADLHNVPRTWLVDFLYMTKLKNIAILDKKRLERFSIKHGHVKTSQSFISRYFDVFSHLGLGTVCVFPALCRQKKFLSSTIPKKDKDEKWIGIAPFARYVNKTYPIARMKGIAEGLSKEEGFSVFLFGARGAETDELRSWSAGKAHMTCAADILSDISQELEFMSALDLMVTMDSSNMHMASLVGTRVISIWGSTTPSCGFLGWQQEEGDCILSNAECQPCSISGGNRCRHGDFHCLKDISPDYIIKTIIDKIAKE